MTLNVQLLPFEVTARTVDHLGREQIADSPTAVSELWKNAFDAYATGVGLHIFGGKPPVAAIFDDGHGMSLNEFADRWLVLGTSAKLTDEVPPEDRNGLPRRERQGQKGIGRLSVAFLGPVTVVISKRLAQPFIASAIDWRAFENPFITLRDLNTPIAEFEDTTALASVVSRLMEGLAENVWPRDQKDRETTERTKRLQLAWDKFSALERKQGLAITTMERMATAAAEINITDGILNNWLVWDGRREHGTALIILGPRDEIAVAADPAVTGNSDDTKEMESNLRATLMGFVDPYDGHAPTFDYGVFAHRATQTSVFLSAEKQFGREDFDRLEHSVDGKFDKNGTFVGKVTAFGQQLGQIRIAPPWGALKRTTRVGSFAFCIGTFEQEQTSSTHTPEEHSILLENAELYAGLRVYRDGLRVMPYGRPEADFFKLEERRSKHAGREFWQHRRVFGRVALSRDGNPHLRDKAGREGLIENNARLQLQNLVIHLLRETARQFFGTDADTRKEKLGKIRSSNIASREARAAARRSTDRRVLRHIRAKSGDLDNALSRTTDLRKVLEQPKLSLENLSETDREADSLLSALDDLRLPPRAGKLGLHEERYLEYRGRFRDLQQSLDEVRALIRQRYKEQPVEQVAQSVAARVRRTRTALVTALNESMRRIQGGLSGERERIEKRAAEDRGRIQAAVENLNVETADAKRLQSLLADVDDAFDSLRAEILPYYDQYATTIDRLAEGLNVDLALTSTLYQSAALEERITQLNALAQMGITVEIVGHELERLNDETEAQLTRLPADVQNSLPYKRAKRSYDALVTRLRFLGPLKVSGPQLRERITGDEIAEYVSDFFGAQFKDRGVSFDPTPAFRSFAVLDYHYRLLPAFMNLINNALYWLQFVDDRRIQLDATGDSIVLSDSGPGVHPDDIDSLFELFFTRRSGGRGIGLYLARANLGASGHRIEYRTGGPGLSGANFILQFKGTALGGDT